MSNQAKMGLTWNSPMQQAHNAAAPLQQAEKQEPVAEVGVWDNGQLHITFLPAADYLQHGDKLYTAPPQREQVQFPTMLRKMWSGYEVQAWLDENVNKEKNT